MAIAHQGGTVRLAEVQETGWRLVCAKLGYDLDDTAERAHAVNVVAALVVELSELGILRRELDLVVLTALGQTFAAVASTNEDPAP